MGRVLVGTSGYSFKDWVGTFYPEKLSSQKMLPFYADEFDTVEVNFTYYRMPTEKTIAGMTKRTPDGFQFFVKAHGSMTHESDLSARDEFVAALSPMRSEGKLAGLLFQFPQSFKNSETNRKYLRAVSDAFAPEKIAVEFRDKSWDSPAVYEFLEGSGLSFVSVDEPQISTLYPPVGKATSEIGYLRFHSRNGAKWYKGGAERYDYDYSDEELGEWLPKLEEIARKASTLFIYFNNCHQGQAAENARRMRDILGQVKLW